MVPEAFQNLPIFNFPKKVNFRVLCDEHSDPHGKVALCAVALRAVEPHQVIFRFCFATPKLFVLLFYDQNWGFRSGSEANYSMNSRKF